MNIALWIIQVILAGMFLIAGIKKSTQTADKLVKSGLNWVERFPISTVRFIGVSELLGGIGLILPWLLNIFPILTPIAAIGLVVDMILASFHHLKYKENKAIMFTVVLMLLTAFVAYGRFAKI